MTDQKSTDAAQSITYSSAGVDVEAGDRAVELMRAAVKDTHSPRSSAGSAASPGCGTPRR